MVGLLDILEPRLLLIDKVVCEDNEPVFELFFLTKGHIEIMFRKSSDLKKEVEKNETVLMPVTIIQ